MEPVVVKLQLNRNSAMPQYLRLALAAALLSPVTLVHGASVSIDSRDFLPVNAASSYIESTAGALTCSGIRNAFVAQLPLPPAPTRVDLKQLAMWGGDFSSTDASVKLLKICQAEFSASTPTTTILADASSSGNGGNYIGTDSLNLRVDDQRTCLYMLLAEIGFNTCGGSALSLGRVRVRYDVVTDSMFKNGFEN